MSGSGRPRGAPYSDRLLEVAAGVGEGLRRAAATLATAESCTGGLIAATLTALPGASDFFWGGGVVYDERAKQVLADVDAALLEDHGPVSMQTTEALAVGIRRRSGATFGLAVTGWAGPTAPPGARIGDVHACVSFDGGCSRGAWCFDGDREDVRSQAATVALDLLRQRLSMPQDGADD